MYQASMFEGSVRGAQFLGNGVYSRVHSLPDGWVMKQAHSRDGTLNWLEWCKAQQDAGKYREGMPIIDRLAHTEHGYVCTMKQYAPLDDAIGFNFNLALEQNLYLAVLAMVYTDYCNDVFEPCGWGVGGRRSLMSCFDDCHGGNIMLDERGKYVITDPNSSAYLLPKEDTQFTLQ